MRARQPDTSGFIERDGVRVHYEVYGRGRATILLLPTWSVLDSTHGRFQAVDLSRHFRVVTFDGRGNGKSDRPAGPAAYASEEFVRDALGVLDATQTDRAVIVGCSAATFWLLRLAANHPDRVLGAVATGTNLPVGLADDQRPFPEQAEWRRDYEGFLRNFFSRVWTERHSENLIESCVATGLGTTAQILIDASQVDPMTADDAIELLHQTNCPWLVIHGEGDELQPHGRAERLAREVGGSLVTLAGAGHCSGNRDPVRFNLLVREFAEEVFGWRPRRRTWRRAASRQPRVLIVPGDGRAETVMRDVRIAAALRQRRPELRVEWLADATARVVLAEHGELIHPASGDLPSQAPAATDPFSDWRLADEARFLTFMILHDLAGAEPIDLVVADGAEGIDHHLHENPELKRFAFAWLTDAIGWVPEPDADDRRRHLMADANAEMIEHVERYPRIRDDAIFFGEPADVPAQPPAVELAVGRDWVTDRFACVGAVSSAAETHGAVDRVADRLIKLL